MVDSCDGQPCVMVNPVWCLCDGGHCVMVDTYVMWNLVEIDPLCFPVEPLMTNLYYGYLS